MRRGTISKKSIKFSFFRQSINKQGKTITKRVRHIFNRHGIGPIRCIHCEEDLGDVFSFLNTSAILEMADLMTYWIALNALSVWNIWKSGTFGAFLTCRMRLQKE